MTWRNQSRAVPMAGVVLLILSLLSGCGGAVGTDSGVGKGSAPGTGGGAGGMGSDGRCCVASGHCDTGATTYGTCPSVGVTQTRGCMMLECSTCGQWLLVAVGDGACQNPQESLAGAAGTSGWVRGGAAGATSLAGLPIHDDFSNAIGTYPRQFLPWLGMPSLSMAVSDGTLIFEKPTQFSASYAVLGEAMNYLGTSIEATMTADTDVRSLSAVCWGNPSNLISGGLQRDEQAFYLHVVVAGQVRARLSEPVQTLPHQSQRVAMEVRSDGSIRGFVDGKLVLSTIQDLSQLPPALTPGINANSYPPEQRFTLDDFMVNKLAQP